MTDAQLSTLWQDTNTSIYLEGKFLDNSTLWEMVGLFMGLLIVTSIIALIISRVYGMFGLRTRD